MFSGGLKKCAAGVSGHREDKQGTGQLDPLYHKRTVPQRRSEVILNALGNQDRRSRCFSCICRGAGRTSVSRFLSTQGTKGGQGWSEGWLQPQYLCRRERAVAKLS